MTRAIPRVPALVAIALLFAGLPTTASAAPGLVTSDSSKSRPTCLGHLATIVGTTGRDRLKGTSHRDVIVGGDGDDEIGGRGGHDLICGGYGSDFIRGMRGRDVLVGGAGPDILVPGVDSDQVIGGVGSDRLNFLDLPRGVIIDVKSSKAMSNGVTDTFTDVENYTGTPRRDRIYGGTGDESIYGLEGDDRLSGGGGADDIQPGPGDDLADGGGGVDTLRLSAGVDRLEDTRGDTYINDEGDYYDPKPTYRTVISTGDGNDIMNISNSRFKVTTGAGDDRVYVGITATLEVETGRGDDGVYVDGRYRFKQTQVDLGRGNDDFGCLNRICRGKVFVHGDNGRDHVGVPSRQDVTLSLQDGRMTAPRTMLLAGFEDATTWKGDDTIVGSGAANQIDSGPGDDHVQALGGDDKVEAGNDFDTDTVDGGDGDDECLWAEIVTNCETTTQPVAPSKAARATPDCSGVAATIVGSDEGEVIDGTPGDDVIAALGGDDTIDGAGGKDMICGGLGDDVITGGGGRDVLHGGTGDDTLTYAEAPAPVSIDAGAGTAKVGKIVDRITPFEHYIGTSFGDTITGADARLDEVIDGGPGDDVLVANAGNDTISGDAGIDTLRGGVGNDRIDGGADKDKIIDHDGGNSVVDNDGGAAVWTGDGADRIRVVGGSGSINSEGGDDIVTASDSVVFSGSGHDRVTIVDGGETDPRLLLHLDSGPDTVRIRELVPGEISLDGGPGRDRVDVSLFADTTIDLGADGFLSGPAEATISGFENATAFLGDNTIYGSSDRNIIVTGGGSDQVFARSGDDDIDTRGGGDSIDGGPGVDHCRGADTYNSCEVIPG